jgi:hypothetical protein
MHFERFLRTVERACMSRSRMSSRSNSWGGSCGPTRSRRAISGKACAGPSSRNQRDSAAGRRANGVVRWPLSGATITRAALQTLPAQAWLALPASWQRRHSSPSVAVRLSPPGVRHDAWTLAITGCLRRGPFLAARRKSNGGECEIRTHGCLSTSPVFKTGAFNRSANSPVTGF